MNAHLWYRVFFLFFPPIPLLGSHCFHTRVVVTGYSMYSFQLYFTAVNGLSSSGGTAVLLCLPGRLAHRQSCGSDMETHLQHLQQVFHLLSGKQLSYSMR